MLLRRLLFPIVCAPATDEGALAAISAAIENPGGAAPAASGGESSSSTDGAAAGGEGGEAGSGDGAAATGGAAAGAGAQSEQAGGEGTDVGKGGAKGAGAETTTPPDPEADRGDGRNAAGRFVKKQGETDEQLAARRTADPQDGKKPGATPDGAAAADKGKKADHVNDPIPDEVKGRTRERIEGLVATAKDLNTKLEAQTAELESGRELFGMIEATGADAPMFARHMEVLGLMCSSDPTDQAQAVKLLRAAADKLGLELGETPTGKDPLEGHKDLLDEVEAGELNRKHAEEIARSRNERAALDKRRTETSARTTEQTAAEQAREKTKTALNELTTELRKKDGDELYTRKHKLLVPFIKRLNATLPPDKIVAAVREAYEAIELAPVAPAASNGNRAPAGTGAQQPARATQGAGGQIKVPTSPEEALEFGLQEHARATGAR